MASNSEIAALDAYLLYQAGSLGHRPAATYNVGDSLQELPYPQDFLPQGGANNGSVLELYRDSGGTTMGTAKVSHFGAG